MDKDLNIQFPGQPNTQDSSDLASNSYKDNAGVIHHNVRMRTKADPYDEGPYVTTFMNIYRAYCKAELPGDTRLVFDWLCANLAYRTGNTVYDATLARIGSEAAASRTIAPAQVSAHLALLESHGFIARSPERTSRATIFINPSYCIIGSNPVQRACKAAWMDMVASNARVKMRKQA